MIQWDTKRRTELFRSGNARDRGVRLCRVSSKNDICPKNETTGYIDEASIQKGKAFHRHGPPKGLQAHPWVLRTRTGTSPGIRPGRLQRVHSFIKEVGVDGFFTDFPQTASNYIRLFEMDLRQQTKLP